MLWPLHSTAFSEAAEEIHKEMRSHMVIQEETLLNHPAQNLKTWMTDNIWTWHNMAQLCSYVQLGFRNKDTFSNDRIKTKAPPPPAQALWFYFLKWEQI